jgi:hypothetical protein
MVSIRMTPLAVQAIGSYALRKGLATSPTRAGISSESERRILDYGHVGRWQGPATDGDRFHPDRHPGEGERTHSYPDGLCAPSGQPNAMEIRLRSMTLTDRLQTEAPPRT